MLLSLHKAFALVLALISLPFEHLFQNRKSKKDKTAIVRLDQIGDFILSRGFIKGVLEKTPDVVIIVNQSVEPIAYQYFPNAHVIGIALKKFRINPFYRLYTLGNIHRLNIKQMIHPVYSRHHFIADAESIIRVSGANNKIGFLGEAFDGYRKFFNTLLTNRYTTVIDCEDLFHDSQKYKKMAAALNTTDYGLYTVSISTKPIFRLKRRYVVLFPNANSWQRQWPTSQWGDLIEDLTLWDIDIVLCGDKDTPVSTELSNRFGNKVINLVGKTSLLHLQSLIGNAQWICGVDGGGIHMAAAYNKKTLAIVGGGHWGRFLPYPDKNTTVVTINHQMKCYGCRWKCIYTLPHPPCITGIDAQSVVEILKEWSFSHAQ